MANTINKDRMNILEAALGEYGNTFNRVSVYGDKLVFDKDKAVTWTVNWASIGSVTPAEAIDFAAKINKAATIADALNSMEMNLVWEDDKELRELMELGESVARRQYEKMVRNAAKMIENEDWQVLEIYLLNK